MNNTMSWQGAGIWFCILMTVGCAFIAWPRRRRRNRLVDDTRSRIDPRDFLQKFYNENGRHPHA
jgi:hypothetical protein